VGWLQGGISIRGVTLRLHEQDCRLVRQTNASDNRAIFRHGSIAAVVSIRGALSTFRPGVDSSLARRLFIGLRLLFDADQGSGIGKTLLRLSRRPPHRPFSVHAITG
jgi:hypothetical protein